MIREVVFSSTTFANQQISSANSNLRWREIIIKVSKKLGEAKKPKNVSIWSMPKQRNSDFYCVEGYFENDYGKHLNENLMEITTNIAKN